VSAGEPRARGSGPRAEAGCQAASSHVPCGSVPAAGRETRIDTDGWTARAWPVTGTDVALAPLAASRTVMNGGVVRRVDELREVSAPPRRRHDDPHQDREDRSHQDDRERLSLRECGLRLLGRRRPLPVRVRLPVQGVPLRRVPVRLTPGTRTRADIDERTRRGREKPASGRVRRRKLADSRGADTRNFASWRACRCVEG
jgi:hypothetical protein